MVSPASYPLQAISTITPPIQTSMHNHVNFDAGHPKRSGVSPNVHPGPRESPQATDVSDDASGIDQVASLILQKLKEKRLTSDNVRDMRKFVESMLNDQGLSSPHERRRFLSQMLKDVEEDIRETIPSVYEAQTNLELSLVANRSKARPADRNVADLAWEVCQDCTKGLGKGTASKHQSQHSDVGQYSGSTSSADHEGSVESAEMSEAAKSLEGEIIALMTLSVMRNALLSLNPSM